MKVKRAKKSSKPQIDATRANRLETSQRERNRNSSVNRTFDQLRDMLPWPNTSPALKKTRKQTLELAISHFKQLVKQCTESNCERYNLNRQLEQYQGNRNRNGENEVNQLNEGAICHTYHCICHPFNPSLPAQVHRDSAFYSGRPCSVSGHPTSYPLKNVTTQPSMLHSSPSPATQVMKNVTTQPSMLHSSPSPATQVMKNLTTQPSLFHSSPAATNTTIDTPVNIPPHQAGTSNATYMETRESYRNGYYYKMTNPSANRVPQFQNKTSQSYHSNRSLATQGQRDSTFYTGPSYSAYTASDPSSTTQGRPSSGYNAIGPSSTTQGGPSSSYTTIGPSSTTQGHDKSKSDTRLNVISNHNTFPAGFSTAPSTYESLAAMRPFRNVNKEKTKPGVGLTEECRGTEQIGKDSSPPCTVFADNLFENFSNARKSELDNLLSAKEYIEELSDMAEKADNNNSGADMSNKTSNPGEMLQLLLSDTIQPSQIASYCETTSMSPHSAFPANFTYDAASMIASHRDDSTGRMTDHSMTSSQHDDGQL